jgi:serine/threonine protein kinase
VVIFSADGVLADDRRFFVKTAGMPENSKAYLSHEQRVALLRNAVSIRQHVNHHSLPKLLNVIESPHGPMLVYEWVPGRPYLSLTPHTDSVWFLLYVSNTPTVLQERDSRTRRTAILGSSCDARLQ